MFQRRLSMLAAMAGVSALSTASAGLAHALAARGEMFANRIYGEANIGRYIQQVRKFGVNRRRERPVLRRNMNHVSRRTRLKHRKARKAA